ncbi:MAG: hypothetical protein H9535_10685 [Ignavibacteria bacterium]|nr:hypothetical protein [Ignavibacteria bacterium]
MRSITVIVILLVLVRFSEVFAQAGVSERASQSGVAVDSISASHANFYHNAPQQNASQRHSSQQNAVQGVIDGIALGITLLALVFLLLIVLIFKKRFYAYVLLYGMCVVGVFVSELAVVREYSFEASPSRIAATVHILCASLMPLFSLLFLRRFMETRNILQGLDRLLQALVICYGFVLGFVLVGYGSFWQSRVMPFVSLAAELTLLFLLWRLAQKRSIFEQFSRLEVAIILIFMLLLPGEDFLQSALSLGFVPKSGQGGLARTLFEAFACSPPVLLPIAFLFRVRDDNKRYVAAARERMLVEQEALAELRRNDALRRANAEILGQQELLENQRQQIQGMNIALYENNQQLSTQNILLKELHTEKDEFLGIVAHDLKNPLAAIASFANILRHDDGSLTPTQQLEFVTHIIESAERMFEIIRNLLDINALERGGMRVQLQPVEISSVLDYAINSYRERAEEKNITLHTDFSPTPFALGDESLVMQVVDNLISNAVKYSPRGSKVTVKLTVEGVKSAESVKNDIVNMNNILSVSGRQPALYSTRSSSVIRFEVRDEGPGLTDDDKVKLFGKFARLSAQPTGGEHSTGLGLSIVKKMVDAMNGRVYCESIFGEGAAFIVELPIADYEP